MSKAKNVATAPQFPLYFSHLVRSGDFVYVSGQVGVDPKNREVIGPTIEEQNASYLGTTAPVDLGAFLVEVDAIAYAPAKRTL